MKIIRLLIAMLTISYSANAQEYTEEWDDYFMPGIGYKTYVPKNSDSLGTYQGVVTEFIIYAKAKGTESNRKGPARVKTFSNLSIMKSTKQGMKDVFFSNFGLNLSFEGKMKRNYFIPVFGIEEGGMFSRNFSTFHYTPTVGIQLVSNRKIVWTAYGGYQYTTKMFDEYSGYMAGTTINVLLWHGRKS